MSRGAAAEVVQGAEQVELVALTGKAVALNGIVAVEPPLLAEERFMPCSRQPAGQG